MTGDLYICIWSTPGRSMRTAPIRQVGRVASVLIALASFVFLVPANNAQAQLQSLAGASFEYIPRANLDPRPTGMENFEIGFSTARAWGALPIPVGDGGTVLMPGVSYAVTVADTMNDSGNETPDAFHEIGVSFGLMQPIGRSWNLLMRLEPMLATNFVDIDRDHIRFNGRVLATHAFSKAFRFGFGVAINYVFGDLLPVPALSVDWTPGRWFRLQLFFPGFAQTVVRLGDRVEVGLAGFLQGNSYTVSDDDIPMVERVKYTVADGGAIAGVRLFSQFWLTGYVGYTLYRQFEILDENGNTLIDPEIDNTVIGRVAIEFRPQPDGVRRASRQ